MEGNCKRNDCKFSHDLSAITCVFWEESGCFKGVHCPFLHGYPADDEEDEDSSDSAKRAVPKKSFKLEKEDFPSLHNTKKWHRNDEDDNRKVGRRNCRRHKSFSDATLGVGGGEPELPRPTIGGRGKRRRHHSKSEGVRPTDTGARRPARVAELRSRSGEVFGVRPAVSQAEAAGVLVGVGLLAACVAFTFTAIRRHVFHDADSLDTAFDAGGRVSVGLTATTIVSQWTWAASLLQSCTVAAKFGISGPYWYAAGATIQIILFAVLSIQLKTRAPGAKTFLQVVHARFGRPAHLVYCAMAVLTSTLVTLMLLLGGTAVLRALVADLSTEMAAMLLAAVFGGYTLIGGLGATFYVSYFNTALIFALLLALVVAVYHGEDAVLGSADHIGGLVFGIVNIVGNFGTVFCDQAYWQSAVAARPSHGVWGFVLGGLTWFAIPFTLATTMGLAYVALSSAQAGPLLTDADVASGLVAPVVAQTLLGRAGVFVMLLLILMAVMSTGSAEVIAVASIIVYDVFQTHLRPFRADLPFGHCPLCSLPRLDCASGPDSGKAACRCQPMASCAACASDRAAQRAAPFAESPSLQCGTHGAYRAYQQMLLGYKSWSVVCVSLLTVPLCLFGAAVNLNLEWTYYLTGTLVSSAVAPVAMALLWDRTSATGMLGGALGGTACGLTAWLATASQQPAGLADFMASTGRQMPMLAGNLASICAGGLLCGLLSLRDSWHLTAEQRAAAWLATRSIDNPLTPWSAALSGSGGGRPAPSELVRRFAGARRTALAVGGTLTAVLVVLWPAAMTAAHPMDLVGFRVWTGVSRAWAVLAAAFIILVPLAQEDVGGSAPVAAEPSGEPALPARTRRAGRRGHGHHPPVARTV
ncbi:Urea-proton symporter DUR3 [Amphibalanus amphitrite]|uniref:Urea-proton symporter DUR3 n=1 Tax=Amphibalanus amphitrite TaxID=1232801 RepID=A0A6A4VCS9_AMPAM|nr:Urea-proton symporter DUR3 [Amphibalanus amphitrite]